MKEQETTPSNNTIKEADLNLLPTDVKQELHLHEDVTYACIGGFFIALICALIWAVITVTTEFQVAYMAIGVGLAVGHGVRFFGAGISQKFGFIGALFAMLGCLLGNLFSQIGFIAQTESLGYIEIIKLLDFDLLISIYADSFSPIDLLFYGFALYYGYRIAFRIVPENITDRNELTPKYFQYRLPLIVFFSCILVLLAYNISRDTTREQKHYYESGALQAQGQLLNGQASGEWHYFYESGDTLLKGSYINNKEQGLWEWYYESGTLMQSGYYHQGLMDSLWLSFHENGNLQESSQNKLGRLHGNYISYYEDGSAEKKGQYQMDKMTGMWYTYHPNGQLATEGNYKENQPIGTFRTLDENGNLKSEIHYTESGKVSFINLCSEQGKQIIIDGNGTFISRYESGQIYQQGKVKDGDAQGFWICYFPNGDSMELSYYKDETYHIESAWDKDGKKTVNQGNGLYTSYFLGTENIHELGEIKNGLREGKWSSYSSLDQTLSETAHYSSGVLNGTRTFYYDAENIKSRGEMVQNLREGQWEWYHLTGELETTVTYKQGKKQGEQVFWDEFGTAMKKEVYDNGQLIETTPL